jgi:hypothetical protein
MNIYAAPRARLNAHGEHVGRPVAVYLVQAFAAVIFPLVLLMTIGVIGAFLSGTSLVNGKEHIWIGGSGGLCIFLLGMIFGLDRRMKAACAAAVFCVSLPAVGVVMYWFRFPFEGGVSAWAGQLVTLGLSLAWAYAVGFSGAAKTYFRTGQVSKEMR